MFLIAFLILLFNLMFVLGVTSFREKSKTINKVFAIIAIILPFVIILFFFALFTGLFSFLISEKGGAL
jgi:uncharacterized membrane protein